MICFAQLKNLSESITRDTKVRICISFFFVLQFAVSVSGAELKYRTSETKVGGLTIFDNVTQIRTKKKLIPTRASRFYKWHPC